MKDDFDSDSDSDFEPETAVYSVLPGTVCFEPGPLFFSLWSQFSLWLKPLLVPAEGRPVISVPSVVQLFLGSGRGPSCDLPLSLAELLPALRTERATEGGRRTGRERHAIALRPKAALR